MKKFIVAMLAVVLGLASCTKESALVGTWDLQEATMTYAGEKVTVTADELDMEWSFTFKADGNCSMTLNGVTETGTCEVKGGQLLIDGTAFDYSVSGKTFKLKYNYGGEKMDLVFKKR